MAADFFQHDFQCGVIQGKVMAEQLQQPTAIGRILCRHATHQRRLTHVQAPVPWVEARLQLCGHLAIGLIQAEVLDHQRGATPHHLHGGGQSFPRHCCAQDVVTIDHTLQGIDKSVQTRTAVEGDQVWLQIRIALALQ